MFARRVKVSEVCASLRVGVCALAVLFSTVNIGVAQTMPAVEEYELKNGLKLLVKPDRRAPVVVSQIWYRIGSSFELTGTTGVSHVLEHMMFKGTDRFGPGDMSDLVAKYGGSENAFTGRDYTGYYQTWEKSRLPVSFAIEANRMTKLNMDLDQFKKEVRVVMEERRLRTDDSPMGTAYERFYAAAYVSSPYQNPVIGWMHDLERLTLDFTKHWYEKWYAPNNSILVVAGDVEPDEVFELAKSYFGDIPAQEVPRFPLYEEVAPKGERRIVVREKVEVPQLMMGFLSPSLSTAKDRSEIFALSMLMQVLDGGLSARFETNLVRGSRVAASIGTGYNPIARGDVLFTFVATPSDGVSLEALEASIFEEIEGLATSPPTQFEMDRALAQIKSAEVFAQDSIYEQANMLGRLAVIDQDWRLVDEWLPAMAKVTPEDVQAVAKQYLRRERVTAVTLLPKLPKDKPKPKAKEESAP